MTSLEAGALYRLMAWLSPAYPTGAFSYSHGLEYAVEAGLVGEADALAAWVRTVVEKGAGWIDALILAEAWRAAAAADLARLGEVAILAAAWRGTAEMALESEAQGRAFLTRDPRRLAAPSARRAGRERRDDGAAGRRRVRPPERRRSPLELSLQAYLQSLAANLVSAGVRLIPLGQTDGQRMIAALASAVADTAAARPRRRARRRRQRGAADRLVLHAARNPIYKAVPLMNRSPNGPLRVGVGGPVGSGKTALVDRCASSMRDRYDIAVVTNDIYTKEDAQFLTRSGALAPERIVGVETGGCPHTAIREDASINLAAVAEISAAISRPSTSSSSNPAATIWPPPSAPSSPTSPSTSSTSRPATRSRARAGPASPAPTCWSSTRSISRPWSAPTSRSWTATPARCAASGRSSSPTSRRTSGVAEIADFIVRTGGLGELGRAAGFFRPGRRPGSCRVLYKKGDLGRNAHLTGGNNEASVNKSLALGRRRLRAMAGAPGMASAAPVSFQVKLDGAQQVPPVQTNGSGTADLTYDAATHVLTWNVVFDGLSGPATMAHFHGPAAAGANAGVLIWMSEKGKMDPIPSPLKGQATLSDAEAADLTAGNLYINIHTAAHKDGEICGQVVLPQ